MKTLPSLFYSAILDASLMPRFPRLAGPAVMSIAVFCSAAVAQTAMPGISSDGNIVTVSAPGGLKTPSLTVNGAGAGSVLLRQGLPQGAAPANNIQITAPAAVAAYTLTLPTSGPDAIHSLLAFSPDGLGYFTAPPSPPPAVVSNPVTLGSNTFNAPQAIHGGSSSLPLVISSSNPNGASIALDTSSVGGIYTLLYTNSSKNTGLWDFTHFRDTLTCSQTSGAVSCGSTHVVSTSGQPTIATDPGAGYGGYASFEAGGHSAASDQSGAITVVTGGSPAASSVVATVTFNQPWLRTIASPVEATTYAPACQIGPANAAAASLSGSATAYVSSASSTAFSILSNATALAPGTKYLWTYKCM